MSEGQEKSLRSRSHKNGNKAGDLNFGKIDDDRLGQPNRPVVFQVARQVLAKTHAIGYPIGLALFLNHRKFDCVAIGEMIENLLGSPTPGMMFAHEGAGSIDHALIARIASILVENSG
jgi:hypothetical protein